MGISFLALADQPDNTVKLELQYEGGFDPKSHAHQQLKLVLTIMERLAKHSAGDIESIDNAIRTQVSIVAEQNDDEMHILARAASANVLPKIVLADQTGRIVG